MSPVKRIIVPLTVALLVCGGMAACNQEENPPTVAPVEEQTLQFEDEDTPVVEGEEEAAPVVEDEESAPEDNN